ncbi:MFS transporter [Streptomyces sp. MCAF7]
MTKHEGLPPLKGPNATPEPSAGTEPVGTEPAAAGLSGIALVVVLTGYALSIVDASIVNVALTSISDDLHGGPAALELVVSGYGLTYALGLVLGGRLGDAFGRRRLYAYGLAAFTVTSALCGLAPTIEFLVAARLLQGAAGAMLVPQVLATIQAATEGQARARAIGMYGATAALGMVTGQILGGLLVPWSVSWPWSWRAPTLAGRCGCGRCSRSPRWGRWRWCGPNAGWRRGAAHRCCPPRCCPIRGCAEGWRRWCRSRPASAPSCSSTR